MNLMTFKIQFDVYIIQVSSNNKFSKLKEIDRLTRKIVDTKKDKLYSLICLLITLALNLLVVMNTVVKGIFNYEFCEKSFFKSNQRLIIE